MHPHLGGNIGARSFTRGPRGAPLCLFALRASGAMGRPKGRPSSVQVIDAKSALRGLDATSVFKFS